MNNKHGSILSWGILLALLTLGIAQIYQGNTGFGTGLTAGVIGASVGRYIKNKKIKKLLAQGLNPYDERVYLIAGKSAYATLCTAVVLSALFVLIGSTLGPQLTVNPFNFLGNCLAILVFIYIGFYYSYSRIM
ncbi:MAG: DUF2178 domain-containing protein [Syntrophomonas sp.]|jgi:uncharacterized membrane protein|nr:DUF2178 domain-containing protein [Syntrophomonas sp.]